MKLILWELWSYAQVPFFVWLFRRWGRRNVVGDIIAGTMVGVVIEFATEPLWDYHFALTFYKDTPISVPLGWGVMFTLVVFASEKLYMLCLRRDRVVPYDKRIFLFDLLAGVLVGFPLEWVGYRAGVWDYNYQALNWDWGQVPLAHMPWELLVGYGLLMLVAPTFVRYWQGAFEGVRPPA